MSTFIKLLWKQKQKVGQCFCLFRLLIAKDGPVLFVVKKVENKLEEESKVSGPGEEDVFYFLVSHKYR